uniref:Uncharacterized protein n=1 Tax=Palpitomonas bilix TaxID=652834 RepID=A0A7S3D037_9EUKA|mmetsp:Transcript_14596/g.37245  ORF Transcript_14596/g.37245 Transcript_14596/m.37245 type:complete len:181 (+) Transcript_14596:102-644(+)
MRKKGSTSQLQKKIMDEEKKGEVERIAAEAKRKQIIDNHRKQAKGRPPSAAANHIQDVRKRINEGARREEEEIAARARKAAAEEVKKRKERERLEKEKEEKEAARIRKMKEDEEKRRKAVLERQKKMKEKVAWHILFSQFVQSSSDDSSCLFCYFSYISLPASCCCFYVYFPGFAVFLAN